MALSLWPVYNLADAQVEGAFVFLVFFFFLFPASGRIDFFPQPMAVIGIHMTKAVLQEIFWPLVKDKCVFRKKRIHHSCLEENAEPQEELS